MTNNKYTIQDFLEAKSATAPSFNADATQVIYLSNATGTSQLYMIPSGGGESMQLTDFEDAIVDYAISPTTNVIVFSKAVGGNENAQLYLLDFDNKNIEQLTQSDKVRHNLGSWSYDGATISYGTNERNGKDFDVFVLNIVDRERRCVYDKGGSARAVGFSPLGTYLTIKINHSNVDGDIFLAHVSTSDLIHITAHTDEAQYLSPRWMPDEKSLFILSNESRDFLALARYTLVSKILEYVLTPTWDIDMSAIDKKAKHIAVVVNEDGYGRALLYDPLTLLPQEYELPKGEIGSFRFSHDGTQAVFSLCNARNASNIWILNLQTKVSQQITRVHQGVPPEVLVEPQLIRFPSFDGLSVPAFIYLPKTIAEGAKIPAIITIHGGPEAQYQPTLDRLTQFYVYCGYAVIAPNVRGSSGYGKKYLALDNVEKRLDSLKDIVALRDYLQSISEIDTNKVVLSGGSYGGFMVLAGLAFYPDLWAAGVDTVGIANFVTFLENTAPYRRAIREAEYGSLAKDRALLESISPIHAAHKIKAPLFVIHGANDPRVPLAEAEQIVSKLQELGREVELVVYPDEGHGLSKLKNRLDAYPKVVAFLDRILKQNV